jgi:hypothetical protein
MVRWAEEDRRWSLFLIFMFLSLEGLLCCILTIIGIRRGDRRERDIRLGLGRHTWGSSDPAYWHPDLLADVVAPSEPFDVKSFAVLARRFLKAHEWCHAMWAARLCTALEDEEKGESLTTEILEHDEIAKKLAKARSDPARRDAAFGEPTPLSKWVQGVPENEIFTVGG